MMVPRTLLLVLLSMALMAAEPSTLSWEQHDIVVLRATFADHTPAERVRRAGDRIEALITPQSPLQVSSRESTDGTVIEIDGQGVVLITDGDPDRLIGETRASVVANATKTLQQALSDRRGQTQGLTTTVLVAVGAGVAWGLICWLILWARKRLVHRLAPVKRTAKVSGTLALRVIRGDLMRTASVWGINLLAVFGVLTTTSVCSTIGLSSLPSTHRWATDLIQTITAMMWDLVLTVCSSLPGLLMAGIIFLMAAAANVVLARFFHGVKAGRLQMGWIDVHTVRPTRLLSSVVLWGAAVVMAYPYLPGSSSDAFKGVTVLLGLMVSLGASSQVGQLASGFILIYLRSIRPGDYVQVANCEGTVKDIGLFTMTLITPFDEIVTLPNVVVLGSQVTNYSRPATAPIAQLQVKVAIGYDTAWQKTHALLIAAANATNGVVLTTPPTVLQRALSDFYVEYTLCVRVADPTARVHVLSELNAAILDQFNAAGIQVMSPHYLGDPATPKLAPPSQPK